jgi:hypothetical protein
MAKKETAVVEKKEFAWDSEVLLKVVYASDKERHDIKLCTLGAKTFIVDTKIVAKAATGWTPVKNSTMELSVFEAAYEAFTEHKLNELRYDEGSMVEITINNPKDDGEKPKKTRTKKAAGK